MPPRLASSVPSANDPEVFELLRTSSGVAGALWRHRLGQPLERWFGAFEDLDAFPAFIGPWPIARLHTSPDLELFGPLVARLLVGAELAVHGLRLEPRALTKAEPTHALSPAPSSSGRSRAEALAHEIGLMTRWLTRVSPSTAGRLSFAIGPTRCEDTSHAHLVSTSDGAGLVAHWSGPPLEVVVTHDGPDHLVTLEPGDVLMTYGAVCARPDDATRLLCVMSHPLVPMSLRDFLAPRRMRGGADVG